MVFFLSVIKLINALAITLSFPKWSLSVLSAVAYIIIIIIIIIIIMLQYETLECCPHYE